MFLIEGAAYVTDCFRCVGDADDMSLRGCGREKKVTGIWGGNEERSRGLSDTFVLPILFVHM